MKNLFWGFALVVIGGLLLLENMGIADVGDVLSDYWPLLLILVGVNILMRDKQAAKTAAETAAGAGTPGIDAELIHASNLLGDVALDPRSERFKGGSVSTLLGDARIDLSRARIADGLHELRIRSVFGSSTVIVPRGGAYAIAASTTLGSLSVLGQEKSGLSSRIRAESPSFAASPGRLKIIISHTFGATRVEEAS